MSITEQTLDYSKYTREELKSISKERNIKGVSQKKKQEIIEILIKNDSERLIGKREEMKYMENTDVVLLKCKRKKKNVGISEKIEMRTDVEEVAASASASEITAVTGDILSANSWKNTKTFKSIKDKETQIKYYKRMNSCEEVLQLVDLESKPFGSESEKIIQEIFKLGPRTSSQNDGVRNGKKIEIKSARYWAGKDDCVWQHLEPDHDYEYALFALLDFQGWKVWGIKKTVLMGEMREKKIVTFQGKQGWWVRKSAILSYLTPIKTIAELDVFIQTQE